MKVILLQTIQKLGEAGKIINVKDGYARNYLIPQKIAIPATDENIKRIEKIKKLREKEEEKVIQKEQQLKEKLEHLSLTITAEVKNEEEIYGSITEQQILKALKQEGIDLKGKKLILEAPIKKLGVYTIDVKLHPKVTAQLKIWVVKK